MEKTKYQNPGFWSI